MNKLISIIFLSLLVSAGTCFAQSDLLSRVSQLQETARQATGGALGCGRGSITLITSRGEITIRGSLDPIHVFGKKAVVADLLALLEARAEANQTGKQNAMSGEVGNLAYVILSTLAQSKDSTVVPVVAKLLDDKDDVIRGWSAIALFELAKSDADLQKQIEQIVFPKAAVQSAAGRSVKPPIWAKVKEDVKSN